MRTRFAPSPTGYLHLGHAYSAMLAHGRARAAGGVFLLRIEDTDRARCRPEFDAAIIEDLHWLGIDWDEAPLRQSAHLPRYQAALDRLIAMDLCYPCRCSRADIRAALAAPQEGVASGPAYPGTCRGRPMASQGPDDAIRLDLARALARLGGARPGFTETGPDHAGRHCIDPAALIADPGDIVLARKDIGAGSYHLAVVIDDAHQAITEVVRGADLFAATFLHRLLQKLLDFPVPTYHHHRLIRDEAGKRLAKRDDARAIRRYRETGATPADIRRLVGLG